MKIRSDFATNSSSVAFFVNWNKYKTEHTPEIAKEHLRKVGRSWKSPDELLKIIKDVITNLTSRDDKIIEYTQILFSYPYHYVELEDKKWFIWVPDDAWLGLGEKPIFSDLEIYREDYKDFPQI